MQLRMMTRTGLIERDIWDKPENSTNAGHFVEDHRYSVPRIRKTKRPHLFAYSIVLLSDMELTAHACNLSG